MAHRPLAILLALGLAWAQPASAAEDPAPRPVTVVAVVDSGFSPYHLDFAGHAHPWNVDDDPSTGIDLDADPAGYIPSYPGAEALNVTVPTHPLEMVNGYASGQDAAEWDRMERSSRAETAKMYRFPGTKIVGAVRFSSGFYGDNNAHGTRSAATAVGNIHGTCPECLVVLVSGTTPEALRWAASQPWIDVVTNSYGHSTTMVARDNFYRASPVHETRAASERGQMIVFSSGNGLANSYDVPMFTYWSSEKGPDWMVTVGAASPGTQQTYLGAGKPVDVSGIGRNYPSAGGSQAGGTGFHSGTSNAAPMVAGYLATTIGAAREALGSTGPQQADGVVARGEPVACGSAHPGCPLGDGLLTRSELEETVLQTALPTEIRAATETYPMVPTTPLAYHYQGRGVFFGHIRDSWTGERAHMVGVLTGDVTPHQRPAGEENWFVVDSKCRQRFWGPWAYGAYRGVEPELDPVADPLALAFDSWCSPLEQGFLVPN